MAIDSRYRIGGRDLFLVSLICLAWAGNFLTSKLALNEFPPLLFTGLRLGLLALLLIPFLKRPSSGLWPRLVVVALCNGVLHFGLSFWALSLSRTLASPAIVMQSYVPMATLLAWWLLGERFHWRTGAAIALSFLGVLVLGFTSAASTIAADRMMRTFGWKSMASLGYDGIRFVAPVRIGDTITVRYRVTARDAEKRRTTSEFEVFNQHGEKVLVGRHIMKWFE